MDMDIKVMAKPRQMKLKLGPKKCGHLYTEVMVFNEPYPNENEWGRKCLDCGKRVG